MPVSQENYSYEELIKYLNISEEAQRNFNQQYPDLSFTYVNPRTAAISILNEYVKKVNDHHEREIAYLDLEEQDTAAIGSITRFDKYKALKRLYNKLDRAYEVMEADLDRAFESGYVRILAALRDIESLTAEFTAERMSKKDWHKEWVKKQEYWYKQYHIKECKKYYASKSLDLEFAAFPDELPENPGVYFLFNDGELIYIGHSSNLRQRIKNHSIVRKYYLKDDQGVYNIDCVYAELPKEEAKKTERKLIELASPSENIYGNDNGRRPKKKV